jgi:hypothetical protein
MNSLHDPDNLVTQDNGQMRRRSAALDLIQLGVADPADRDADQHLACRQGWLRHIRKGERLRFFGKRAKLPQEHCFHGLEHIRYEHLGVLHVLTILDTEGFDAFGLIRFRRRYQQDARAKRQDKAKP